MHQTRPHRSDRRRAPRTRRLTAVLTAAILCALSPLGVTGAGATQPATQADQPSATDTDVLAAEKIEPELTELLLTETETDFWVRFDDTADLDAASRITGWNERGTAVAKVLRTTAEESQAKVRAQLDSDGETYRAFWATNAIRVEGGTEELARELSARPEVDSLHPTTTYEVPEPPEDEPAPVVKAAGAVEWGIASINADDVWAEYGVRGAGITVANIDTGVQFGHPALVGTYRGNLGNGEFDHDYNWFDAQGACTDAPCDRNGHGTHTMGTMVGDEGDNRIGVAPEVDWITANGCCPTDEALITSGQWMLEPTDLAGERPDASKRPHIINNSWGSELPSNDPFMEDVMRAWAASGIFGVWSNGNSGPGCETSGSPGSRPLNYSVGAYDVDNQIAEFSSRGVGADGEVKPNIAAPGVAVRSSIPGNTYRAVSGTSMAAPHVAGTVALLWSASPALIGDIDGTRARLDGTAVDTADPTCGGTDEDNNVFGEGRLDALALVDSADLADTGRLAMTVVDAETAEPIAGAEVEISGLVGRERTTAQDGTYALPLPGGDYTITVSAFGYETDEFEVTVVTGDQADQRLELAPKDTVAVTGTVTDGSGQGWPLYADITVEGRGGVVAHTSPTDGRYRIDLPVRDEDTEPYRLTVRSASDGYETVTEEIDVTDRDVTHNVTVPVDADRCEAPGYTYGYDGEFASFDDGGSPDGWTVVDNIGTGHVWRFDDPSGRGNRTGGEGGFAIAWTPGGPGGKVDTTLLSPIVDLRDQDAPQLRFRQDYLRLRGIGRIELSVDGGTTWETLLEQDEEARGPREEAIELPQAAHKSQVRVRFHQEGEEFSSRFWQLDDIFVGTRTCDPVPGALVMGQVTDRNTGAPIAGADVIVGSDPARTVESSETASDSAVGDGFYSTFVPTGKHRFEVTYPEYRASRLPVRVGSAEVVKVDVRLRAGRLSIEPEKVDAGVRPGRSTTKAFTITNTGSAPVELELRERDTAYPIPRADDAPGGGVVRVPGTFSPLASGVGSDTGGKPSTGAPASSSWVDLAAYPHHAMDIAVGELDGRIYAVGGRTASRTLTEGYVYDPTERTWAPIADLPGRRQGAAGAVIDGTFYVAGGWGVGYPEGQGTKTMFAYDPATDTWTRKADAERIFAVAGRTVLDGQLYVVGGCTNACHGNRVQRYDPASDTWELLAPYPEAASHTACAGIDGKVYCAGGARTGDVIWNRTYAYDPATDTWTRMADMPISLFGGAYTTSADRLIVSGGVTGGAPDWGESSEPRVLTNETFAYDPATDTWTQLAVSGTPMYRSGSTCGLMKVGGSTQGTSLPGNSVELLPTYADCFGVDVDWMSIDTTTATLAPGRSARVVVELDGRAAGSGEHLAGIWVREDTPYLVYPIDVRLRAGR